MGIDVHRQRYGVRMVLHLALAYPKQSQEHGTMAKYIDLADRYRYHWNDALVLSIEQ